MGGQLGGPCVRVHERTVRLHEQLVQRETAVLQEFPDRVFRLVLEGGREERKKFSESEDEMIVLFNWMISSQVVDE